MSPTDLEIIARRNGVSVAAMLDTRRRDWRDGRRRPRDARADLLRCCADEGLTIDEVRALTGWPAVIVGSLAGRARVKLKGREPPPPPRSDVGLVSQFRDGYGNRAGDGQHPLGECANYERCLMTYRGMGAAHCPRECARWEAATQAPATAYASLNGACRGLPVLKAAG